MKSLQFLSVLCFLFFAGCSSEAETPQANETTPTAATPPDGSEPTLPEEGP